MASEMTAATNTLRQNEDPFLKKLRKSIVLFIYFLIEKDLYLKSFLFGSKIEINALMQGSLCSERLIRGVTKVLRKRWAYLQGTYMWGGGEGLIGRGMRYVFVTCNIGCLFNIDQT